MSIPLEHGRSQKLSKEIARLKSQQTGATKEIRRLLQKALIKAHEADNGNLESREEMLVLIDSAIDRGMASNAILDSPGMSNRISKLLDRTPSLDHAAGLLYEAAGMLAESGDNDSYTTIMGIAEGINTASNVEHWRTISRPQVLVPFP